MVYICGKVDVVNVANYISNDCYGEATRDSMESIRAFTPSLCLSVQERFTGLNKTSLCVCCSCHAERRGVHGHGFSTIAK